MTGVADGGVTFHHPVASWFRSGAVTVGVLLHLPMYPGAREMGYQLAGMGVDGPMKAGMALIVVGWGSEDDQNRKPV